MPDYGRQVHISVWELRTRSSGHHYVTRRNHIERIVSKKDADKLNRHYNRHLKEVPVHD